MTVIGIQHNIEMVFRIYTGKCSSWTNTSSIQQK